MSNCLNTVPYIKYGQLQTFTPDQTVIVPRKYLPRVRSLRYEEEHVELPPTDDWYPMCNSYYPFTENVDVFTRVSHLIESKHSKCSGDSSNSSDQPHHHEPQYDSFSENAAQQAYLRTKPMNFLFIGKPDIGQETVAKMLADYRKCVYIHPKVLLEEQISSNSRAGQCIEFNLRSGRSIGIDVIIRLLAKKLQTRAVRHRGFIICGFPLVPNDLYEEDPISSESAIFNVREIFEEIFDGAMETLNVSTKVQVSLTSEQASVNLSMGSKPNTSMSITMEPANINSSGEISIHSEFLGPKEIATDLERQLNVIFGLLMDPFILVYFHCGNADVVSQRENYYFDIYSKKCIDMQKIKLFYEVGATNELLVRDLFEAENNPFSHNPTLRHLVRLPQNFPAYVRSQLSRYHKEITNELDSRILMLEHQNLIKVDGRNFRSAILDRIKNRLRILPLQNVLLPQKFVTTAFEVPGEGDAEPQEDEVLTHEEAFQKHCRQGIVSPLFKYVWSDWGAYCPVAMAHGKYVKGNVKNMVHFMNHIFFLSDENAFDKFLENPRPYLLPPFPKPGSRIFVYGPPVSGKSSVAKCLGYLLDYEIFSTRKMQTEFVNERFKDHIEKVKQSALTEAIKLSEEEHQRVFEEKKLERLQNIAEWETLCLEVLEKYKTLKEEPAKTEQGDEIKSQDEILEATLTPEVEGDVILDKKESELTLLKNQISELNLPPDSEEIYWQILLDKTILREVYLPEALKLEPELQPVNVLDDFITTYVQESVNAVDKDQFESDAMEAFSAEFVNVLRQIEANTANIGWIFDAMSTDLDYLRQIFEDIPPTDIIILKDGPGNEFLMERFQSDRYSTVFTDFREVMINLNELEASFRCQSESTESFKQELVHNLLEDIINVNVFQDDPADLKAQKFQEYQEMLAEYESGIQQAIEFFNERGADFVEIPVTGLPIQKLCEVAVTKLRDKYRRTASEFTELDRAEEVQAFLAKNTQGGEGEGDGGGKNLEEEFAKNRRYGNTSYYCPVTLSRDFVLWRGKEDFAAKFEEKIYLMSSAADMQEFISHPREFVSMNKPIVNFPPPRILVVGVAVSGKTTVSKLLARNLGVRFVNYEQQMKRLHSGFSTTALHIGSNEDLNLEEFDDIVQKKNLLTFLNKLWFREPIKYLGFVLDGFPMTLADLQTMIQQKTIPDAVICMTVNPENKLQNVLDSALKARKVQIQADFAEAEEINTRILDEWREKRDLRYNEIIEEKRQKRYLAKLETKPVIRGSEDFTSFGDNFASETQLSIDSIVEEKEHEETLKLLDEELPEPELIVVESHDATEEELIETITREVEEKDKIALENLEQMRQMCEEQLINWYEVPGDIQLESTKAQIFKLTDELKFRNISFLQRCYEISLETAEKLIEQGYFFLSRYGRQCPVQYFENQNCAQLCIIHSHDIHEIFPIIYRQYIYFTAGKRQRDAFLANPLKYVFFRDYQFRLIPYRIAIIGPPKCGKTALAKRIDFHLGFLHVSRGKAIRYVLDHLPFSMIRKEVEHILRNGGELSDELVIRCVQAITNCGEGSAFGVILDGFPNSIAEMNQLKKIGFMPHLIFDLQNTEADCYKYAAQPNVDGKYPQFSQRFVAHLYKEWLAKSEEFRRWCDREYQNIYKVKTDKSMWGVWEDAQEVAFSVLFERRHYYNHAKDDWPLRLANMIVTPLEFLERQSNYKTYCPVCLHHTRALKNGGDVPDRTGLIHFREYFYWICEEHIEEFLLTPEAFIPPQNICLPQDLPEVLDLKEPPRHPVEDGLCVVCYLRNIPRKVKVHGNFKFAASIFNKIYLFDSQECLDIFMANPYTYAGVVIHYKGSPGVFNVDYDDLPVLGMLEQYIASQLIKSVHHVGLNRPIIPGLSISQSALICIGLHLKVFNPNTIKEFLPHYMEALDIFHQRRKDLLKYLERMKNYLNPHLNYDDPDMLCQDSSSSSSSTSEEEFQPPPIHRRFMSDGSGDSALRRTSEPPPEL